MARSPRLLASLAVIALAAGAVQAPVAQASDDAQDVHPDATSLGFAGWRVQLSPIAGTRAVVTVAATGACGAGNTSVAVGAEQRGPSAMLGAAIYSQCLGGSPSIVPAFETTAGPVAMSTIGALVPGNVVLIDISTSGGFTTVNATGPLGSDSMTVPDILAFGYRVGIRPLFFTTAPSLMQNFGILLFQKNTVNTMPLAAVAPTKVHLVDPFAALRAKTSPIVGGGAKFKVKWIAP
jgi:hypothetical protein